MPKCRLCLKERDLRNSHIVPEFLYGELYNDKHQLMGITGVGNHGWKAVQKGLREHLFCEKCEQHINDSYEKPFHALWVDAEPLPNPWEIDELIWVSFDYAIFKLFHLSVLFRASLSDLPTYGEVSLGPHEEVIRDLLLTKNPGSHSQYPLLGYAVIHHESNNLIKMVTQPIQTTFQGHRCYGMMYGGVHWWWSVSSHQNQVFEHFGLQENGTMPFHAEKWNQVGLVQSVAEALRNSRW